MEIELPLGTLNYRMITSCKIQLANLFLTEESLTPMMVVTWVVAGCTSMPILDANRVEFTLDDLKLMKREARSILSAFHDYANNTPSREAPNRYTPPHKRAERGRTVRTIGTQTENWEFDLLNWAEFQAFLRDDRVRDPAF